MARPRCSGKGDGRSCGAFIVNTSTADFPEGPSALIETSGAASGRGMTRVRVARQDHSANSIMPPKVSNTTPQITTR